MFRRFATHFRRLLPLSVALSLPPFFSLPLSLSSQPQILKPNSPRIKIVSDIGEYIQTQTDTNKAVLICELHGDQFIDNQLLQLAHDFASNAEGNVSTQFDFVLIKHEKGPDEEKDNFMIVYSKRGEKVINLEPYINANRRRSDIKMTNKALLKRLIEAINGQKQIRMINITQQLASIDNSSNYTALVVVPDESDPKKTQQLSSSFLKTHQIKQKSCSKYVVRDYRSKQILGLGDKSPDVYLLSSVSNNLSAGFKNKVNTFKIGQKTCFVVPAKQNLKDVFVIPPVQPELPADEVVLNVYINKNQNSSQIQQKLLQELSKPQYRPFHKSIYYTNDVDLASLSLQLNDYSRLALQAFDPKTPLPAQRVREILLNTFEWQYQIKSKEQLRPQLIRRWVQQSTGKDKMKYQHFKSSKIQEGWSVPLTGLEYKNKRDQPGDKVIYHYSEHCHGCKKFGGKYEEFAKNRTTFGNLKFYRINNDRNKAQGVRNFNSTPVFAYYKDSCPIPFIYRMPYFTEQLFESFLRVTGAVKVIDNRVLNEAVARRKKSEELIRQLMQQAQTKSILEELK